MGLFHIEKKTTMKMGWWWNRREVAGWKRVDITGGHSSIGSLCAPMLAFETLQEAKIKIVQIANGTIYHTYYKNID